jgi:hypothetical protein
MRDQDRPRARPVPVVEPLIGSDRYDYADAYEIRVREPDERSAEEIARFAMEGAPWQARWFCMGSAASAAWDPAGPSLIAGSHPRVEDPDLPA